ncbi:GvpL/GvpF family gas vesicle protein [Algihabitans albus]|uniref:GvpL/GvpF family gas vesicle protein n=1 Tax=Algihabitans albus TaxID=2164067 RepID=UPI000E5CC73C|nr:GvpL/GvpF family gas vesicle protein [Algihabitans albus]
MRQMLAAATSRRRTKGDKSALIYLYGVVSAQATDLTRCLKVKGLVPDRPLYLVPFEDLVALVSKVPLSVFSEESLKERFQDHDWVQARALDHHRVLTSLPPVPLLPFKFCTLFADETALLRALESHHTDLQTAFAAIQSAREWGVKLFVDYGTLSTHLKATAPHLTQLARRSATVSPGTAFFLKRKLETMAGEAARNAAGERARAIHKTIAKTVRADKVQPVQSHDPNGKTKDMLSNVAYLVPRDAESHFKDVIAKLARHHMAAGLSFDVVGPLPPYSFAMISADGTGAAVGSGDKEL